MDLGYAGKSGEKKSRVWYTASKNIPLSREFRNKSSGMSKMSTVCLNSDFFLILYI